MADVINKINAGGAAYNIASTAYATCTTAAGTTAKVAYIDGTSATTGFTLIAGTTVHVKFTNTNTASSPTLSINGTTAKTITCYGSSTAGATPYTSWRAGEVVSLTYDGTTWQINKNPVELASLIARISTLKASIQDYINNGGGSGDDNTGGGNEGGDGVVVPNLTEIKALDPGTAFTFNGDCWVVYKSGNYTLLQDATGYITVYQGMSSYSVSTKLSAFTGTTSLYQGTIQVNSIANITTNGSVSAVTPTVIECIDSFELVPGYYQLQNKYFETYSDGTYTWWRCSNDQCVWIRSDCSSCPTSEDYAYTFDVAILSGYNGTPPPLKFTPGSSSSVVLVNFEEGGSGSGPSPDPEEPEESSYTLTTNFCGTTTEEIVGGPGGGEYKLSAGGCSLYLKQSDTSLPAARTNTSGYKLNGSNISGTIQIFYYKYTSIAMNFAPECLSELAGGYITGIDLYLTADPDGYEEALTSYAGEAFSGDIYLPNIVNEPQYQVGTGVSTEADGNGGYIMHIPFDNLVAYDGQYPLFIILEWNTGAYKSGIYLKNQITFHYSSSSDNPTPDTPGGGGGGSGSGGSGGSELEVFVDFAEQGFANAQPLDGPYEHYGDSGGVTSTFSQASGTSTPKYYTTGGVRLYRGNTFTITTTDGQPISKIDFTFASSATYAPASDADFSCDSGTFNADTSTYTGTWTGNADNVTFTVNKSQIRIQSYTAYGNGGGAIPT